MNKTQRKELFNKLDKLPKAVSKALTVSKIARHLKIAKGVCHG